MTRSLGDFNQQPDIQQLYESQRRRRQERRRPPETYITEPVPIAPAQQYAGERPCRCGSMDFIISKGKGPHAAGLSCSRCGRFSRWLSRAHFGAPA